MEVLIASSIFAVIMVMTTGVLAQASNYQTKIKAIRESSEESKRLADLITRNVREASYPARVQLCKTAACTGADTSTLDFKNGIVIIKGVGVDAATGLWGVFVNNTTPSSEYAQRNYGTQGQILITTNKDNYKVYFSSQVAPVNYYAVYYKEFPRTNASGELITLTSVNIGSVRGPEASFATGNLITDREKLHINTFFSGFAPDDGATVNQQPYVQFYLISKTRNYDALPVNSRARSEIRSSVTGRGFNY